MSAEEDFRRISTTDIHRHGKEYYELLESKQYSAFMVIRNGAEAAILMGVDHYNEMKAEIDALKLKIQSLEDRKQ